MGALCVGKSTSSSEIHVPACKINSFSFGNMLPHIDLQCPPPVHYTGGYVYNFLCKNKQDSYLVKKHVLVTVAGIAGLACVGWLAARHAEHVMLDKSIDSFRQAIGPDASFTYKKAWPGLLGRSVKFTQLVFRQGPETITADEAEISKLGTAEDEAKRIGHLSFRNFQLADPAGSLHLDDLSLEGVTLPAGGDDKHGTPAQGLEIKHAEASRLHGFISGLQSDLSATGLKVDDYGSSEASRLEAKDVLLSTDVAPQRHITAHSIMLDGVDLAGLYSSLATGGSYEPHNGTRDIQVDGLGVDGTGPLLRVAKLSSHSTRSDASEQEVSSLQGLELWPDVPNLSILPALGYDRFRGSLVLNDTHDYKAGKLHVATFSLDAPGMGRLTLDGDFSQTSTAALLSAGAADMQVMAMNMSYKDHGLLPKVLAASAKARGVTAQELTTSLQTQLAPQGSAPDAPLPQIARYLAHPGGGPLTITLHPPQPLPMMAIAASISMLISAPQVAQQIGLTVHAP